MKNKNQPFLKGMPVVDVPKSRQSDIDHVRSWLNYQPHLPTLTDEHLHLYLHACYDNLERTKHMIESYYTFRSLAPELFTNRNLLDPHIQTVISLCEIIVGPKLTPEGYTLVMFRFVTSDASKYVYFDTLKAFFIAVDFYLSEYGMCDGLVLAIDIKNFNLGHVARAHPFSLISKTFFFIHECMAIRLKGVHVFNSGPIIEKVLGLIKPFMTRELAEMMHFHATVDTLSEYLPKDILPDEYGGKAGSMTSIYNELLHKFQTEYTDWLIEGEELRSDESKRVGKCAVKETLFSVDGSFRKLDID